MNRRGTCRQEDGGASSVVGFILIFAVSLVTIAIVLLSGGPTLDRVQTSQEVHAMSTDMQGLSEEILGLVTGAPAQTTPAWRASFSRGTLTLTDAGHIWGYAVDRGSSPQTAYYGINDGDNTISFSRESSGSPAAYTNTPKVIVNQLSQATSTNITSGTSVTAGSTGWDLDLGINPEGSSLEIKIWDGPRSGTEDSRIYLIDSGAIIWSTTAGGQTKEVAYENTAVFSRQSDAVATVNQPALRPPQETGSNKKTIFLRALNLTGAASVGGGSSATLLLDSGGNHQRFSHQDVSRVQIYPSERYLNGWARLLDDDTLGYDYDVACSLGGGSDANACSGDSAPRAAYDKGSLNALAISIVETAVEVTSE